jgi:hypothetical protein
MRKKLLVANAVGVGLFLFLAGKLIIVNKDTSFSGKSLSPSIVEFVPSHGLPGEVISVSGQNLAPGLNSNAYIFKINGIAADVVKAESESQVHIRVPATASSGKISVEEFSGRSLASSSSKFIVLIKNQSLLSQRRMKEGLYR